MDRHIHPNIAEKVIFNVGNHWEKAELGISNSPLGMFLHHTLNTFLAALAKDCIVWKKTSENHDTYQTPYFLTGNKKVYAEQLSQGSVEYFPEYNHKTRGHDYKIKKIKKIDVSQFLTIIKNRGFDFKKDQVSLHEVLGKLYEVVDVYIGESDLKADSKDDFTWLDSKTNFERAFASVGSYIHGGIREKHHLEGSIALNDANAIRQFIDKLICDISGIKEQKQDTSDEPANACGFLPKLDRLTKVQEQVLVHMQRLSINGILHAEALEKEFFIAYDNYAFKDTNNYYGTGRAQQFGDAYKRTTDWFGENTRRAIKGRLEKLTVAEEIPNLYRMMEYIYKLYKTGQIYISSNDTEQKHQGEVLVEVAKISSKFLENNLINISSSLLTFDF